MIDFWRDVVGDINAPAVGSMIITPSDTDFLSRPIRGVTINGGGTIRYIFKGVVNVTSVLPEGTYSFRADQITSTGTTATQITGWV
jgi:hypothetical protein